MSNKAFPESLKPKVYYRLYVILFGKHFPLRYIEGNVPLALHRFIGGRGVDNKYNRPHWILRMIPFFQLNYQVMVSYPSSPVGTNRINFVDG